MLPRPSCRPIRATLLAITVTTVILFCFLVFRHRDDVHASIMSYNNPLPIVPQHNLLCPSLTQNATLDLPIPLSPTVVSDLVASKNSFLPILPPSKGNPALVLQAQKYIKAIMDPHDKTFLRVSCQLTSAARQRYASLQIPCPTTSGTSRPRYFFALDLHQTAQTMPQLFGSIVEAIKFLGPHNCVLSVVEGRSTDGTYEILRELGAYLERMGLRYLLQTSAIHPQYNEDRIVLLAELRNLALREIYEHPEQYAPDTTIIFINDVWICTEDILELVHQQFHQDAHMTCGMDWTNTTEPGVPRYYDLWVGRSMTGESFYSGFFDWQKGIFWDDEYTFQRWEKFQPVQVFACWNGIVALTAKPFMNGKIRFRGLEGYDNKECFQGEPNLLAKDLWYHGYGRIQTLPSITTAYEYYEYLNSKRARGSLSDHFGESDMSNVEWKATPPRKVKCRPQWENDDRWLPWNFELH